MSGWPRCEGQGDSGLNRVVDDAFQGLKSPRLLSIRLLNDHDHSASLRKDGDFCANDLPCVGSLPRERAQRGHALGKGSSERPTIRLGFAAIVRPYARLRTNQSAILRVKAPIAASAWKLATGAAPLLADLCGAILTYHEK
jgi:hypothetical protein